MPTRTDSCHRFDTMRFMPIADVRRFNSPRARPCSAACRVRLSPLFRKNTQYGLHQNRLVNAWGEVGRAHPTFGEVGRAHPRDRRKPSLSNVSRNRAVKNIGFRPARLDGAVKFPSTTVNLFFGVPLYDFALAQLLVFPDTWSPSYGLRDANRAIGAIGAICDLDRGVHIARFV